MRVICLSFVKVSIFLLYVDIIEKIFEEGIILNFKVNSLIMWTSILWGRDLLFNEFRCKEGGRFNDLLLWKIIICNNNSEVKEDLSNKITGVFQKISEAMALGIALVWAKIVVDKCPFFLFFIFTVRCINNST